ncbi:MAG TPA: hypothetical protein DD420_04360 [Streptomyces sp.]|nr:hypothetical protein [Armatimonadota bacterium]HBF79177.1 hypothetical protein [Streptomyces sp.]
MIVANGRRAGASAVIGFLIVVLLASSGWAQGQEPAEARPDLSAADVRAVLAPMGFEVGEVTIDARTVRFGGPGEPWPIQYFRATTVDGAVSGALTLEDHVVTDLLPRGAAATVWREAEPVETAAEAVSIGRLYQRRMGLDPERWIFTRIKQPDGLNHWTLYWRQRLPDGMPTYATANMTISVASGALIGYLRFRLAPEHDDVPEPVITAEEAAELALAQVGRKGEWPYLPVGPLTVRGVSLQLAYKRDADDPQQGQLGYLWNVVFTGLGRYAAVEPGRAPFKVAGVATVDAYTGEADAALSRADVTVVDGELFTW